MIRIDKKNYIFHEPEDIFDCPENFISLVNGKFILNQYWGSLKFMPKRILSYFEDFLNKSAFSLEEVLFLILVTSRCYSSISWKFKTAGKNFKQYFYIEDIFHDVLDKYLQLKKEGVSFEDVSSYTNNKNMLEKIIIKKYFKDFYSICLETSYETEFLEVLNEKEGVDE